MLWDLDETLIVFNTLLNDKYAEATGKPVEAAKQLGNEMEDMIFSVLDKAMYVYTVSQTMHGWVSRLPPWPLEITRHRPLAPTRLTDAQPTVRRSCFTVVVIDNRRRF